MGKTKDKKKSSQKKLLSLTKNQLDEPNEEDVFQDKKKKKKKKHKEKHTLGESMMNESLESISEGKKKKKDKEKSHSHGSQETELLKEDTFGGKKKKKDKEKKRRLNLTAIDSNETRDDGAYEESPKKKKKSDKQDSSFSLKSPKKSQAEEGLDSSFSLKTPKKSKFEGGLDTSLSLKTPKKSKFEGGLDTSLSLMSSKKKRLDSQEILVTPKSAKKVKEVKQEDLNISTSSKKKKKKKERSDETEEEEEEEKTSVIENGVSEAASTTPENSEPWSMEEELHLLDKMKGCVDANNKVSFKVTLNKMNWEEVAFVGRTAEECKEKFSDLIRKVCKVKSMTMVVEEAKLMSLDEKVRKKRVLTPKNLFIKNYCKSHSSGDTSKSELFLEASAAWLNLSKKEKKTFEVEYENEVKEIAKKQQRPPNPPKTPFIVYYSNQTKLAGTKSITLKNKCQKCFKEMEFEEKIPFIRKSITDTARYIREFYSYKEAHPEWTNSILIFSSKALLEEYFYYMGMPKNYKSALKLFYEELKKKGIQIDCEPKERLSVIGNKYRELPDDKKQEYIAKLKKLQMSYDKVYQVWKESQHEDLQLVLDTYFNFKRNSKKETNQKFDNVVEVSVMKPKYLHEPLKPPVSALKIFSLKFEQRKKEKYSSTKELKDACSVAWKTLSHENKLKYEERHKENMAIYKESILEYVRNLGGEAKTYVGFKRMDHYKFFKEDIFKTEYPNEEFPVYIEQKSDHTVMPTLKKPDVRKSEKDASEGSEDEDQSSSEEDDESEVESEDDTQSAVVMKGVPQHPRTPVVPQKAPVGDSSEEDEEEEEEDDVLEAWQTPKHHTGNSDKEEDDDDDDNEDGDSDREKEQEEDSDDKEEEDDDSDDKREEEDDSDDEEEESDDDDLP